jgi:hypothetical protein
LLLIYLQGLPGYKPREQFPREEFLFHIDIPDQA